MAVQVTWEQVFGGAYLVSELQTRMHKSLAPNSFKVIVTCQSSSQFPLPIQDDNVESWNVCRSPDRVGELVASSAQGIFLAYRAWCVLGVYLILTVVF